MSKIILTFAAETIFVCMSQRKTLSNWLTTRYLFVVREEENFAERLSVNMTLSKLFLFLGGVIALLSMLCFLVITTILSRWADPRHQMLQTKRTMRSLNYQIDSLNKLNEANELYLTSLKKVINGDIEIPNQSGTGDKPKESMAANVNLDSISPVDSMFRKEFEESDYEALLRKNNAREALQQLFFFTPIKGIISDGFNPKKEHYGVDVVSQKDEPVKAVADGTVIMASWTQDAGYVIALQHRSQVISLYKHNSVLLKRVGDMVRAGDALAIVGNSGEYTNGPHLHFELWYEGNPVDPEDFVHF